jgi:hypothetical protein
LPDLLRLAAIVESVGARPTYALPTLNW